jgi:hypothetical protein
MTFDISFDIESPFTFDIECANFDIEVVYDIEVFASDKLQWQVQSKGEPMTCPSGILTP